MVYPLRNIVLNKSLKKTATEDSHDLNTDASSDNKVAITKKRENQLIYEYNYQGLPQLNGLYYAIGKLPSNTLHLCLANSTD